MALPKDFIARTQILLGDAYADFEKALQADVPTSIRINERKLTYNTPLQPVAWSSKGKYLNNRLSFTFDPLFHAGTYYVQEAASMFLEQAIQTYVKSPICCLDLCAAPGGKSTLLHSILPQESLVISNEVIRTRSNILAENIAKWGYSHAIVTNNDPKEIGTLTHLFDLIVADVPCSGEGMFRKDSDSTGEWSIDNVQLCASRQRRIIHDVWDSLAPGGLLIYSTCTYNVEENEENIHYIATELGAKVLPIPTNEDWGITNALKYDYPVYRFLPHKTKGEGFFLAVLRKEEGVRDTIRLKTKKEKGKQNIAKVPTELNSWIKNAANFSLAWRGETAVAFPKMYEHTYQLIASKLKIVSAGISLGEQKGKDILPAQQLALSLELNKSAFNQYNVTWKEAIQFLKKEAMQLPETLPKGYVLLCYNNTPLGFVKQLGKRANNLYPNEWRIRTGYLPEEVKLLE
jgi:16S rRNA C967 or C1407 C5-methylase (RsmB/RsmF family)/NOL1/NOP2/fmu family ribosome biogenesis protein